EDAGQHLGGDADAGVAHRDDRVAPLPLGGQPDAAAAVGVLGRVVEQVRDDLRQPGQVAVQGDRALRQRDAELEVGRLQYRAAGLDRGAHDLRQLDPLDAQFQPVAADPGDVHQVVDEPGHVLRLAGD